MRSVRISKTFRDQIDELIAQGYPKFGERVVTEKRDLLLRAITDHLAADPRRPRDTQHGLCVYSAGKTPFVPMGVMICAASIHQLSSGEYKDTFGVMTCRTEHH